MGARTRAAAAVLLSAVVLAGCGGGDKAASTTTEAPIRSSNDSSSPIRTSAQVCELVSRADAVKAADAMVAPTPGGPGIPSCTWTASGAGGRSLTVQFDRGAVAFDAFERGVKSGGIPLTKAAPVDGVGDKAYWDFSADPDQPALRVRRGEDAFVVTVVDPSVEPDELQRRETDVTKVVLTKV